MWLTFTRAIADKRLAPGVPDILKCVAHRAMLVDSARG